MDTNQLTRLKVLLEDYFLVVAAVLVLVGAVGGWATYSTIIDPGTHVEERTAADWSVDGGFDHHARVVQNSTIFSKGEIRDNRMFYITNSTPKLATNFWFSLGGDTGNATVEFDADVVEFAHYEQKNEETGEVFQRRIWELREPRVITSEKLDAGERTNISMTIDADALRKRTRRLHEKHKSLYQISDIRTQVFVTATVNGTIDSYPVHRQFNYTLPINSTMDYYVVSPTRSPAEQVRVTKQVTVPNRPSAMAIGGSLAMLLVPLGLLGGLVRGRQNGRFEVSSAARTKLQNDKIQAEFEEWITTGSIPALDDQETIAVDSLEGLVDVAFDSNRRVIEDRDTGTYVVQDSDIWYQYTPEWADTESASDDSDGDEPPE